MSATLAALDLELFKRNYLPGAVNGDVLEENTRTIEQQLLSLRFLTCEGLPNRAALLVFGEDPLMWIPGAYIQFVRIDGVGLADPIIHQQEIKGPLPTLINRLDEVLKANISVVTDITSATTEQKQPDYPIVTLQQLTRNAIMHRSYELTHAPTYVYWFSNRIEIHSPGGLYGRVNRDNFGQPGITDYRNPLIAEAMKNLGFVQRFGMGIPIAKNELERNGNPELEFNLAEPTRFLVTIRKGQ